VKRELSERAQPSFGKADAMKKRHRDMGSG